MCCPAVLLATQGNVILSHSNNSSDPNTTAPMCGTCGATPARRCGACGSRKIQHGAASSDEEARWLAFYCHACVENVRAAWPEDLLRPLRRQWCLACRRTAIYGPPGKPPKDAAYCQRHKANLLL